MAGPIHNPCAKAPAAGPNATRGQEMGPQSQRRLTLQERTHKLAAAATTNKRKSGQRTLLGGSAFDSIKDCPVCKARTHRLPMPHRAHHKLCINNKRTKGITSTETMEQLKADRVRKQQFAMPLRPEERADWRHSTVEAGRAFFAPRPAATTQKTAPAPANNSGSDIRILADEICKAVTSKVKEPSFISEHANKKASLAMAAFAGIVVEKIIRTKQISNHFQGLTMRVPPTKSMCGSPHCHSIVGQELLLVDWTRTFGLQVSCPACNIGELENDRTNFSKNKLLFPTFSLDAPPKWCVVMSMVCSCCKRRFNANDGEVLASIPAYAAAAYPVEPKCALPRNSHLARSATEVFDMLMTTHGNGELCSRLSHNTINRAHAERTAGYLSCHACNGTSNVLPYLARTDFVKAYPPLGDSIRDACDDASSATNNAWGISDHDRGTREMQGVGTRLLFVHDHTHEVTKNYFHKKKIGANALWDAATETGEIAVAVLVPSTKTSDFTHAATCLSRRTNFKPTAMHTDTWPCKSLCWDLLFASQLTGRLGLFHFLQRIIKTIRKRHIDYFRAVNLLLDAVHFYNPEDHEASLRVPKDGSYSGKKHSNDDILELKLTKYFRQRYGKHLRKETREAESMRERLDGWFARFKCVASEGSNREALGRLDPITKEALFTADTKDAIRNCREKADYLQDPLPLEQMHHVIMPNPNSPHGLKECLSRRGESNLESFHLNLAHFGNSGMRDSLADNLNLTGTARHNLAIRHKLRLSTMSQDQNASQERSKVPAAWESVLGCCNHSELQHVNDLGRKAGIDETLLPFQHVETLPEDNGERFFSACLKWLTDAKPATDANDLCLCSICSAQQSTTAAALVPRTDERTDERTVQVEDPVELTQVSNVPAAPTIPATLPTQPALLLQQQMQLPKKYPFLPRARGMMMWHPFQFMPQHNVASHCCHKHRECCSRADRRGRPPHDHWCAFKNNAAAI